MMRGFPLATSAAITTSLHRSTGRGLSRWDHQYVISRGRVIGGRIESAAGIPNVVRGRNRAGTRWFGRRGRAAPGGSWTSWATGATLYGAQVTKDEGARRPVSNTHWSRDNSKRSDSIRKSHDDSCRKCQAEKKYFWYPLDFRSDPYVEIAIEYVEIA